MEHWKTCSSCKKEIEFSSKFFECSVSTCTGKRTGYVFCSFHCFERHLPGARHRDAGAVERVSPTKAEAAAQLVHDSAPVPTRRIISPISTPGSNQQREAQTLSEDDILIVVSKMKNYIKDKSEMNTSGDVAEVLSHFVRRLCDDAIVQARNDGRKTVMGRDFADRPKRY